MCFNPDIVGGKMGISGELVPPLRIKDSRTNGVLNKTTNIDIYSDVWSQIDDVVRGGIPTCQDHGQNAQRQ